MCPRVEHCPPRWRNIRFDAGARAKSSLSSGSALCSHTAAEPKTSPTGTNTSPAFPFCPQAQLRCRGGSGTEENADGSGSTPFTGAQQLIPARHHQLSSPGLKAGKVSRGSFPWPRALQSRKVVFGRQSSCCVTCHRGGPKFGVPPELQVGAAPETTRAAKGMNSECKCASPEGWTGL